MNPDTTTIFTKNLKVTTILACFFLGIKPLKLESTVPTLLVVNNFREVTNNIIMVFFKVVVKMNTWENGGNFAI